MEHFKATGKVDPDYESYNSALEITEEEDKKEVLIKFKKIIEDEFNKEIFQRQEQIERIEIQICKVRKLLHFLRYALIMSYYKKQELEYNGTEDEASTSDSFILPDKQNRIHPALKKLLGKNVHNLEHLRVKDKRKSSARIAPKTESDSPEIKKIKLDPEAILTIEETVKTPKKEENIEFVRNRKKTKYRVVVGNISKWMPSSEDDALTHKWMVYVRGPKEAPDVSHFIEKVVYYLHPSYKPHDVVEVCESPFHLSRRGWGEFPVRVQIFFKVTLNKPIDIIHNLKLDKTYTGRQTLGNETLVDVFLYDDFVKKEIDDVTEVSPIKNQEEAPPVVEHDYCSDVSEEISFDHSYCRSVKDEGLPIPKKEKIEQDETNSLIYGLENYIQQPLKNKITQQLIQLNRKDINLTNAKIIVLDKKSVLTMGKILPTFCKDYKITLPKDRFKNMGEVLPFLFKRLPLYSELANSINYKRMYPFTAPTLKDFLSWNIGKRRSAEWSRAKTIKKILTSGKIHGSDKWNTKALFMYGRSHDYTPFISYGLFYRETEEKHLIMNCFNDSGFIKRGGYKITQREEPEVTVNVDSDTETNSAIQLPVIDITESQNRLECSFIRQSALDCGIILKHEDIIEGVKVNGAELMILSAVKCLVNNLIRRARNHRICVDPLSSNANLVTKEDVKVAINERPELICLQQLKRNEFS